MNGNFLANYNNSQLGLQPVQQSGINQGNTTGIVGGGMNFGQGLQMGTQAIGAISDLYNMWQARQNYKLSKESFKFNKQLSTVNTNNQANLTNERLATRQAVRVNNDPNAVPVAQFMQSYGVKGIGG